MPCADACGQGLNGKFGLGRAVEVVRGSHSKGLNEGLKQLKDSNGEARGGKGAV